MFIIIWEYVVKPGQETQFERMYGPSGLWVALFTKAEGYEKTELLRDTQNLRRYMTIDYWESKELHQSFLTQFHKEYHSIDAQCSELTESETAVGEFITIDTKT